MPRICRDRTRLEIKATEKQSGGSRTGIMPRICGDRTRLEIKATENKAEGAGVV
jgi:hypothetical protein